MHVLLQLFMAAQLLGPTKHRQWDTVVSAHRGKRYAHTWNSERGALGAHKIVIEGPKDSIVQVRLCCEW